MSERHGTVAGISPLAKPLTYRTAHDHTSRDDGCDFFYRHATTIGLAVMDDGRVAAVPVDDNWLDFEYTGLSGLRDRCPEYPGVCEGHQEPCRILSHRPTTKGAVS